MTAFDPPGMQGRQKCDGSSDVSGRRSLEEFYRDAINSMTGALTLQPAGSVAYYWARRRLLPTATISGSGIGCRWRAG